MTAKETALALIQEMPDDVTADVILAELDAGFEHTNAPEEDLDAAWTKEIRRRVEEIRAGGSKMIPGDELMRELREKYG